MSTKKKPVNQNIGNSPKMNFRPQTEGVRPETKGTKPLPEPATVQTILIMMVIHLCRKALFVDTGFKIAIYGGCLFILSLIADFIPMPKTYLARTDNIFNVYFVKLGWGWTLLLTLPFIVLTSYTYCCGQRDRMIKHILRLLVATGMWYFWTSLFSYIEFNYGKCYIKSELYDSKKKCTNAGHVWRGLDLSGHAFLLIYSTLVIIEEARAINGWEAGGIAILMWYVTYRYWFTIPNSVLCLPGEGGPFKYRDLKANRDLPAKKRSSVAGGMQSAQNKLPKFMGMPLYGLRAEAMKDDRNISQESEQVQSWDESLGQ
ncbi:hypothetical protein B566_EDAN015213 [Ephemera danica]|nr:hypothetical protein B566_EDAN015213 [Ephemera danica]